MTPRPPISTSSLRSRKWREARRYDRADELGPGAAPGGVPARIYNVGNHRPEGLTRVVTLIEKELGLTAQKEMLPLQPGDVVETFADVQDLMRDTGFAPDTPIAEGVQGFVAWYRQHYRI